MKDWRGTKFKGSQYDLQVKVQIPCGLYKISSVIPNAKERANDVIDEQNGRNKSENTREILLECAFS